MIAYRSADKKYYVLEQNSLKEMLIILLMSTIYPGVTIFMMVKNRHKKSQ